MDTLAWIVYFLDLLPIIIFLFFLTVRKKPEKALWVIFFYSTYSFASNSKVIYDLFHGHSFNLLAYIFTLVEYLLFATFLYMVLSKPFLKRALLFCSVLFTSFCLINIFFQPKYQFDSLQSAIESLLLLIFCILYLFEQINKPQVVFIYASYKFWIITGILTYLATSFFLYAFAASLPFEQAQQYWVINHISNILKNILFAISIIVYAKSPKTPLPPKSLESDYQPFLN
jgi:hypothetical protein